MADYCTLAEVREELIKQGNSALDDAAISARIPRATAAINAHCRHSFDEEAIADERRRGGQVLLTREGNLRLTVAKGFCQSVSEAAISADLLTWYPLNCAQIDIDRYSVTFVSAGGSPVGIPVTRGRSLFAQVSYIGGYPADAPEAALIKQCACRWTAFMYMKRQSPFDVTVFPDVGQVSVPSAVPSDVIEMLEPFVRRTP